MTNVLYKIGITHGDLNGISYEVIMKALQDNKMLEMCTPVVYGLTKVASYYKKLLEMNDFNFQLAKNIEQLSLKKPNLVNISDQEVKIELGTLSQMAGSMAELSLNIACKDLKNSLIDAIVTAPINKKGIQSKSFNFEGHTEYLSHHFKNDGSLMMMLSDMLRVGFVTNHLPLKKVSDALTVDLILHKLRIMNHSLIMDFASTNPKIAVLALNPHAGEDSLIGKEETEVIIPAIKQAFDEKINAFGPFPADGFFGSGQYTKFDGILALYHDQGMIPFKLLSMDQGVNYTAGLPIVRTSPAHGTAYDIAGKNRSSGQSMRSAVYQAIDIVRNRKSYEASRMKVTEM